MSSTLGGWAVSCMGRNILLYEFADDLGGRLVLRPASGYKLVVQVTLYPDTEIDIFHSNKVYATDAYN